MTISILILTGATASGKTALATHLAPLYQGEIINADSRQIYQDMDIGTAKPPLETQLTIQHHLFDLVKPDQTLTLAEYQIYAKQIIAKIHARGKLPMLVGGTGLYITALIEGWQMPEVPPNPELRARLEALSKGELLAQLQELDPLSAQTIDADNPRRLVRAVEVCLESGRPFSELRRKTPPDYQLLPLALTLPRETLYARADTRVDQMLAAGWVEEVRHLTQDLGYSPSLPAFSALGYPEIAAHLRGEMTLAEAREKIKFATHHFIRRQYTWLRGHPPLGGEWVWFEPHEDVRPKIEAWLAKLGYTRRHD